MKNVTFCAGLFSAGFFQLLLAPDFSNAGRSRADRRMTTQCCSPNVSSTSKLRRSVTLL